MLNTAVASSPIASLHVRMPRSVYAKGVKIQLIVRGICCLRTGIEGTNDNIEVRSIVGNFLEHARIFCFENDGKPEYYCASADWMPRNLERRVRK